MTDLQVGTLAAPSMLSAPFEERQRLFCDIADAGIQHVFVADHISFFNGTGMDGLLNAAVISASHPTLKVCVGVYLLALRHPIAVARQLATLAEAAPGRLIFGVGVGGEDRNEVAMCGVDPRTRGRRTNECLAIINALLAGEKLDFAGEFFKFERASIRPTPRQRIPMLVGGRSDAAIERAAQFADGWLGVWCSPQRFEAVVNQIAQHSSMRRQHGLQIWVGVDDDRNAARARLAKGMEQFYQTPFDRFAKYSPAGSAAEIAEFLKPYRDAGCTVFNIMPIAPSDRHGIEAVGEIRRLLA